MKILVHVDISATVAKGIPSERLKHISIKQNTTCKNSAKYEQLHADWAKFVCCCCEL